MSGSNFYKRRRNVPWVKAEAIADRNATLERKEALKPVEEDSYCDDEFDDERHPHDMEDGW